MSERPTVRIENTHGTDSQPDAYGVPREVVEEAMEWYESLGEEEREAGEAMRDITDDWHVAISFFDDRETEVGFGKIDVQDEIEGIVFTSLDRVRSELDDE